MLLTWQPSSQARAGPCRPLPCTCRPTQRRPAGSRLTCSLHSPLLAGLTTCHIKLPLPFQPVTLFTPRLAGLTIYHIKSHLQKYRLNIKLPAEAQAGGEEGGRRGRKKLTRNKSEWGAGREWLG